MLAFIPLAARLHHCLAPLAPPCRSRACRCACRTSTTASQRRMVRLSSRLFPRRPPPRPPPLPSPLTHHLPSRRLAEVRRSLYCLFGSYGKVIDVVYTRAAKVRGTAFVVFRDLASSTAAMRGLDGESFYGKSLVRGHLSLIPHPGSVPLPPPRGPSPSLPHADPLSPSLPHTAHLVRQVDLARHRRPDRRPRSRLRHQARPARRRRRKGQREQVDRVGRAEEAQRRQAGEAREGQRGGGGGRGQRRGWAGEEEGTAGGGRRRWCAFLLLSLWALAERERGQS